MRSRTALLLLAFLGLVPMPGPGGSVLVGQPSQEARQAFEALDRERIIARLEEFENREYDRTIRYKVSSKVVPDAKADPVLTSVEVTCENGRHLIQSVNSKNGLDRTYSNSEFGQFSVEYEKSKKSNSKLRLYESPQDREKVQHIERRGLGRQAPVLLPLTAGRWADFFQKQVGLRFENYREDAGGVIRLDFKSTDFVGSLTLLSAATPVIIMSTRTRASLNMVTTTRRDLASELSADGLPRCVFYEEVVRSTIDGAELFRGEFVFSDYSTDSIPEESYQLSAYGLPDPEGLTARPKRSNHWQWFAGAAVILGSVSIVLRRYVRDRPSRHTP